MSDKSIELREYQQSDLAQLAILRNDIDSQLALMSRPRPNTSERIEAWLAQKTLSTDVVFFIIADHSTNEALGYVQIDDIDLVSGTGFFGICLAKAARGHGYAAEAIRELEYYGKAVFNLRKLCLQVLATNTSARGLYTRLNYQIAGTLKEHFYISGEFVDVLVMEKALRS